MHLRCGFYGHGEPSNAVLPVTRRTVFDRLQKFVVLNPSKQVRSTKDRTSANGVVRNWPNVACRVRENCPGMSLPVLATIKCEQSFRRRHERQRPTRICRSVISLIGPHTATASSIKTEASKYISTHAALILGGRGHSRSSIPPRGQGPRFGRLQRGLRRLCQCRKSRLRLSYPWSQAHRATQPRANRHHFCDKLITHKVP